MPKHNHAALACNRVSHADSVGNHLRSATIALKVLGLVLALLDSARQCGYAMPCIANGCSISEIVHVAASQFQIHNGVHKRLKDAAHRCLKKKQTTTHIQTIQTPMQSVVASNKISNDGRLWATILEEASSTFSHVTNLGLVVSIMAHHARKQMYVLPSYFWRRPILEKSVQGDPPISQSLCSTLRYD